MYAQFPRGLKDANVHCTKLTSYQPQHLLIIKLMVHIWLFCKASSPASVDLCIRNSASTGLSATSWYLTRRLEREPGVDAVGHAAMKPAQRRPPPPIHREGRPIQLRRRHRLGIDWLAVAADAGHRQPPSGLHAGRAPLLEQEAVDGMHAHLIEELRGGHRPAVITQQGFALAVEGFEHVLAIPASGEAEAGAQLPLEDVKERPAGVTTIATLGLGEGALQQAVLAKLEHLLFGLIALGGDGGHPLGRGLFHLAFAQFHALLEDLLLAFGLLQAGVFLGVDLREAVELLTEGADLLFKLVVLAALGPERIGGAALVAAGAPGGVAAAGG